MKNPAPQSARGFRKLREIHSSSLAVFYVEQVALNRHDNLCQKRERLYLTTKRCCQIQLHSLRFADCPASVIKTVETYHLLTNNVSRNWQKRRSSRISITIHLTPLSCDTFLPDC